MYGEPSFARQGWECPKCGRVYSPDTPMCWYCGDDDKSTVTTTTTKLDMIFPDDLTHVTCNNSKHVASIHPCIRCNKLNFLKGCNTKEGCKEYQDYMSELGKQL